MLKEGRKTDAVIGNMRFFANHKDIELSSFRVLFDNLFTENRDCQFIIRYLFVSPVSTYINEMATMPNPTTTIFCRRLTSRSITSLLVLLESRTWEPSWLMLPGSTVLLLGPSNKGIMADGMWIWHRTSHFLRDLLYSYNMHILWLSSITSPWV